MTKRLMMLLLMMLIASPMIFAQTNSAPAANQWVPVAAVFSMAIAAGMCGLAQGKAVVGAAEGMARNPSAAAVIRVALLLGLVLIESLALYTLVMGFIVIYR